MTRILLYSICAVVPVFITEIRIKENECATFHFNVSGRKKCIFSHCFIQNWEEIESLKNEKSPGIVLEKSWNSVFPFPYEPWVRFKSCGLQALSMRIYVGA